jgi:hypothetical protein
MTILPFTRDIAPSKGFTFAMVDDIGHIQANTESTTPYNERKNVTVGGEERILNSEFVFPVLEKLMGVVPHATWLSKCFMHIPAKLVIASDNSTNNCLAS